MPRFLKFIFPIFLLSSIGAEGQLRTLTADGNWSNSGIWAGGLIADTPGEDATMNNSVDVTVLNTESFTIGNLTANNNNSIIINAGGSLTLSPGNFLTAGNGTTINVAGVFTINGDFQVNNNVTLIITGTMIVLGNVDMGNNGSLSVSGGLSVGGNFTGGNNTAVTVSAGGSIDVDGDLTVGNGSTLSGTGTVSVGGSCDGGGSSFCSDEQLPVELLFFNAQAKSSFVQLTWATSSELNFDYFSVERSSSGEDFSEIGIVKGSGNSLSRIDYSFMDLTPRDGSNYYRIKSVDFDGYTEHFRIERVDFTRSAKLNVYPNPVSHGQTLTISFGKASPIEGVVVLHDLMGRTVRQELMASEEKLIEVNDLAAGIYFVEVTFGTQRFTSRVLVR